MLTAAYLPVRLAQRLGPEGERECRFDGTVMVADVAGYARLTAALAGRAEDAVERLSQTLARAFRAGLDAVDAFGGEVVYLAGDALIGYWQADAHWPGRDLDRASACAHLLVRSSALRGPVAGSEDPPLHVGLASGPLWAAQVGGWSGRFNLLFGGRATRAAFAAARCATAGQVWQAGASGEPAQRIDEHLAALAAGGRLPLPAGHDGAALAAGHEHLLPPDIERRAELDDGVWSPELRSIDCLFLRLPTLDEEAPAGLEPFRRALTLAQQRLKMPSGTGRLVIDDKGLTLVWVAGEPMAARAPSPEASLALAAHAFESLRQAGLRPAAGFASGRAFCATLGNDRRREPVVVGTPMVLAARLMDRDEPDLLAAGPPVNGTGGFSAQAGSPVTLKGFSAPLPVFRLRPTPAPAPATEEVIGRDGERAVIEASLDDLAAGRGGVLLISGPAGMGKSALMRVLVAAAQRRRLPLGQGEAFGAERRVPYFPWRTVLRALLADLPFDDPPALRQRLTEALAAAGRAPALAPLLEVVFPAGFVETDATRIIVGENRARTTQDLLSALLPAGPQVIAIEDLHHMDSPSLQLLEQAARRLPAALFVLTTRPQPLPDAEGVLARVSRRIDLQPLLPDDFARLARQRLNLEIAPSVAEEVCRRAHGIPLYGFEYLRQAREALTPDQRQSAIAELPASMNAPLPIAVDPLRGVLMRSFESLSALENRALKAASVLGERFSRALLEAIVNDRPEPLDLQPALQSLAGRGLITAAEPLRFSHALIQTSCYETIPVHLRRTLHGRAAAILERAGDKDSEQGSEQDRDERLVTLAHHHHFAENHASSIQYSERAAGRAHRQGAYREAMRLLDQCLHAADRLHAAEQLPQTQPGAVDPRIRWRRLKAEAAGAVGDGQTREQEARRAIELTGARPPARPLLRALAGAYHLLRRSVADPGRLIATRPEAPRALDHHRELARAHRQLAVGAYFLGRPVEMVYNTGRALAHAERLGRSPELADCLASIGGVYGVTGFARAGRRHLVAARALASELGDEAAMAFADVSSALFLVGQGDWENVRLQTERCQQISRRTGDSGYWGYGQALRFWMHHYRGEIEEADRCASGLWEASREVGNRQHQSWAARFLAQGSARRRDWAQARQQLETARALYHEAEKSREVRPIYELQPILADLALALFQLGDRAQALALEDGALTALGSARPAGHAILEGISSMLELELSLLAESPGRERLARARRALALLGRYCRIFPIGRPRLHLWRGRLQIFAGRRSAALTTFRAGAAAARALSMEHDHQLLTAALAS